MLKLYNRHRTAERGGDEVDRKIAQLLTARTAIFVRKISSVLSVSCGEGRLKKKETLGRFEMEREDLFALREFVREREQREQAFALPVDDKAKLV